MQKEIRSENNTYLAVGKLHGGEGDRKFKKSTKSSYVYLTKDKNEAAVWEWSKYPERLQQDRLEVPLSKKMANISKTHWVYKNILEDFDFKNIKTFPHYVFYNDNTFDFTGKSRDSK